MGLLEGLAEVISKPAGEGNTLRGLLREISKKGPVVAVAGP